MKKSVFGGVLLCSLVSAACSISSWADPYCEEKGTPGEPPPDEGGEVAASLRVAEVLPVEHNAIDLLFVVDDSRSMSDEQEQLGVWSSELFNVLTFSGELPDLHVAVISSSLTLPSVQGCERGGDGRFHTGDADLGGERFLRDIAEDGERQRNYAGSLNETFAQMAKVGELGCGFEQPFEATRRALSGEIAENAGFLRDDALLVVVIVSDEDDCSASNPALYGEPYGNDCSPLGAPSSYRCFEFGVTCADGKRSRDLGTRSNCRPDEDSAYIAPVSGFASFLKGLKRHPGEVIVAGVYGKPHGVEVEPDYRFGLEGSPKLAVACESTLGSATPGIRINGLLSSFPARAAQSSICEPDLSWAMRNTALIARGVATRSHCLAGPIADAGRCRVSAMTGMGSTLESRVAIPPCQEGETERCFTIDSDPTACAETSSQLSFRVQGQDGAPDETLTVDCDAI